MSLDPRLTPCRDGIASRRLEGLVPAEVYLDPAPMSCAAPATAIRSAPEPAAEQVNQLLFGEVFEVIEDEGVFLWGQALRDGYVGFVEAAALRPVHPAPTHRVSALRTYAFARPGIKASAAGPYSLGALVAVQAEDGRFRKVAGGGWMVAEHLSPVGVHETDWAAVAERYLGTPYLWGGRESLGLDCSGLVQQALFACGRACPRDTDQQAGMGRPVAADDLARGDLVFWKGHVAMMLDGARIIHANGHHMATVIEPLAEAVERISAGGHGEPTGCRRI